MTIESLKFKDNYWTNYAVACCSSKLDPKDRCLAFTVTSILTAVTGGLFFVVMVILYCCRPSTSREDETESLTPPASPARVTLPETLPLFTYKAILDVFTSEGRRSDSIEILVHERDMTVSELFDKICEKLPKSVPFAKEDLELIVGTLSLKASLTLKVSDSLKHARGALLIHPSSS